MEDFRVPSLTMYYTKHPFLKVGLPFLTAIIFGTMFLVDLRKSRYESQRNVRLTENELIEGNKVKRNMKSLEEELKVTSKIESKFKDSITCFNFIFN